jgi:hypothetical protein
MLRATFENTKFITGKFEFSVRSVVNCPKAYVLNRFIRPIKLITTGNYNYNK